MKEERWEGRERVNMPERKWWTWWDSSAGEVRKKFWLLHFRNQRSTLRHKDSLKKILD